MLFAGQEVRLVKKPFAHEYVLKTSGIVSAIRTDLGLAANCLIDMFSNKQLCL